MFSFFFIKPIVFIINALGIWLVSLVNSKQPKTRRSFLFGLMVFLMFVWVDFAYLARVTSLNYALLFIKLAWAITPFFFIVIVLFLRNFLYREKNYSLLEKVLIGIGLINIPLVFFSPLVIKNIWFDQQGVLTIGYGQGAWLFFGEGFFFTILGFYTLLRGWKKASSSEQKIRIGYLALGLSFFFLMNIVFNLVLPVFFKIFHLYEFGDYSSVVLVSIIAYAIIRHHLFGIRVVLTSVLVGLIVILLGVDLFIFTSNFFLQLLKGGALLIFIWFGYLLIKSVLREIEQKEQLDQMASDLATANVRLEAALQELRKLDQAKTDFMNIVSHQLRTPLTIIKGITSMALEGSFGTVSGEMKRYLRQVFNSTERLVRLVNSFLGVTRLETGKVVLEIKEFSLSTLAEKVVEEFKVEASEKGLDLRLVKPQRDPLKIEADEQKVREILSNLIDNALKYTSRGKVVVSIKKINSLVRISVADTGAGIAPEEMKELFKTFSRVQSGRMWAGGTGLGLYIVRKFVEMHGGKVWAESPGRNQGSTFYVDLPVRQIKNNKTKKETDPKMLTS